MALVEDIPAFFGDFGVVATLGAASVRGILDETPGMAFGNALGGYEPRFTLRASDLPADPRVVSLVVGATTFNIRDWHADGTGLAMLILEAA